MKIRIYDNCGKTIDRYTVVLVDYPQGKYHEAIGMSENPFHPQGFYQHGLCLEGKHLGKRIRLSALPTECQKAIELAEGRN